MCIGLCVGARGKDVYWAVCGCEGEGCVLGCVWVRGGRMCIGLCVGARGKDVYWAVCGCEGEGCVLGCVWVRGEKRKEVGGC